MTIYSSRPSSCYYLNRQLDRMVDPKEVLDFLGSGSVRMVSNRPGMLSKHFPGVSRSFRCYSDLSAAPKLENPPKSMVFAVVN